MCVVFNSWNHGLKVPFDNLSVQASCDNSTFLSLSTLSLIVEWVAFTCTSLLGCIRFKPMDVPDVAIVVAWNNHKLGPGGGYIPDLNAFVFTSYITLV